MSGPQGETEPAIEGIAIIGMAGRFPGAPDTDAYWRNLCLGRESITRFDPSEAEDSFSPAVRAQPNYVAARGILDNVEMFDAEFFGMLAREAELTDPQHRILLECAWEALEDAGYDPAACRGAIGVFAGASMSTYFLRHVAADPHVRDEFTSNYQLGSYGMLLGALPDVLATRVSYKLGLRGPSMTVQSACSTSLVAVAQACQSLLLYQSDMALAGGVSITLPQKRGYLYQEGGMASSDGHCRTFDARSSGTVFGGGAGMVLLKRLSDALADGDHVYAVIRGTAINNDGDEKVGFTAPSVDGQAAVIMDAQAMAGCAPETIGYVECHGTATPLGDPIEIAGLVKAFGSASQKGQFCALGSVKTNIGHLDVAAGVAGLIKTALALKHGKIPPTLHFSAPNPRIDFASTPFFVNATVSDWPMANGPRRAGVSAFGVGGTNVHAVLEEEPARPPVENAAADQLIVLSARTETALSAARTRLALHLRAHPEQALSDVAFTLQAGRHAFAHRNAWVCADRDDALAKLANSGAGTTIAARARDGAPAVAFMFPGQGAQYPAMGRGLYEREPVFREAIDTCAALLLPSFGQDLRDLLYGADEADADALRATAVAQPVIFAVEYALARFWMDWGVQPTAMIGHSVGEFVAACLAGVIELEDALNLVALRGRLLQALPSGAMLAVRLPEADLVPLLGDGVDLAAINGPSSCVASGPHDAVAALEARLASKGISARRLQTSHAFHSSMMQPALAALTDYVRGIRLNPPALPYISGVTGRWITDAEAMSPDYWARHCREPVRFADGIACLAANGAPVLLEVGPGRALATMAQQGSGKALTVVSSLPESTKDRTDRANILHALGRLWAIGAAPDWRQVHGQAELRRVSLPTYPFERRKHWIDPPAAVSGASPPSMPARATTRAGDPIAESITGLHHMNAEPVPFAATAETANDGALRAAIVTMLETLSGEDLATADPALSFLELGFDSLLLGQFVQQLQTRFGVQIGFRALLSELPTITALTDHLLTILPAASLPLAPASSVISPSVPAAGDGPASDGTLLERIMREQLQAMQTLVNRQLETLRGIPPGTALPSPAPALAPAIPAASFPAAIQALPEPTSAAEEPSRFQVYRAGGSGRSTELNPRQRQHIDVLVERYTRRTAGSKRLTQQARPALADPRAAAGFRSEWKEIVYPIVCARSKGSRIWDVDGNEYIDLVNGYGQIAFGHSPDFVVSAIQAQLENGFAIGPQAALAGEVAALFCEMTGNQRMTFCNTGSEAVMAAMRVARTVTGRSRIVMFTGDYHGQFDEVLVKGTRSGPPRALPAVPGVPPESVGNIVVLSYGGADSLAWIRANARDLAAVIVEPVQSRHPDLQPRDFVRDLREITAGAGAALVFDEVVTGFRTHPGGMQALWDVRADLATYGKILGGGMPIGVLAGSSRFMDALDGGMWRYGDESIPEVAPTFFAGTFVRHPLVLAACHAVLLHMKDTGPAMLEEAARRTARLSAAVNEGLRRRGLQTRSQTFSSWLYLNFAGEAPHAGLIWHHLRDRGVHVQDGFPWFLTTTHTDADVDRVVAAFDESLDEMQAVGLLGPQDGAAAHPVPATAQDDAITEAPLTESQMEILLSAQLGDAASCAFNESISIRLDGRLDPASLIDALRDVIDRHDALRVRLETASRQMSIAPHIAIAVPEIDLSATPEAFEDLIRDDAATPFDLTTGPLIRARLVRLGPLNHVLVLTAHHIICDGWSTNVIVSELAAFYAARCGGYAPAIAAPPRFSAYARERHAAGIDPRTEAYWLGQFAEPAPLLELPSDRVRPAAKSYRGATHRAHIDADLTKALKRAGARQGCTLFMTLLGGFQLLLGRLSGQQDIVTGIPSAGQSRLDDQMLVGHCVHFLPLRACWDDATSLKQFLQTVRERVLNGYENQEYTLGTLVQRLNLPREPGRIPLVEAQFNLEQIGSDLVFPGLQVAIEPNPKQFVNFDLFLNAIESAQGLRLDVDYNTDLFDAATIERWIDSYTTLLSGMLQDADVPVARLPILAEAERRALLIARNDTSAPYPADMGVDGLFAAQVAQRPDATAAIRGGSILSYRALDERANRLARYLLERVPQPNARIGVLMDRSTDLVATLLAVMKAGFAYIPLDPSHPSARINLILEESGAAAVVTDRGTTAPRGIPVFNLEADAAAIAQADPTPPPAQPADRAAYVIYTSGSTGRPKGVEVMQRSLVNLLWSVAQRPGFDSDDRMLAVTTVAFDIAGLELFLPLVRGGQVEIATAAELADHTALLRMVRAPGVSVMQATPSLWRIMLDAGFGSRPGLRMLCGGEPLSRELADRLLEGGGSLWNMYGPTETTIWSSVNQITADGEPITAGRPIANTRFYLLDRNDQPVPAGVVGELCIAGDGLARGYVGRPDLTSAAFRPITIDGHARQIMYRTGDLARWNCDGSVSILGRLDSQIKLRGFRIELGEIEAALSRLSAISACAALLRSDLGGAPQIVCYFVPAPGRGAGETELRHALSQSLPDYMIPAFWVRLDKMPLTANGKLDRAALPLPEAASSAGQPIIPPSTPLETTLAAIWAEVLKRDAIGVNENLFALGADSLHLFQIVSRMTAAGIELSAHHLLLNPTIADLAAAWEAVRDSSVASPAIPSLRQFLRTRQRDTETRRDVVLGA